MNSQTYFPYRKGFEVSYYIKNIDKSACFQKQFTFLGSWILREIYEENAGSYRDNFNGPCGIALPANKSRSSWRILWWRKGTELHIIRWTLPKILDGLVKR